LRVIIDRRGDRYVKELSDPQTGQLLQSVRKEDGLDPLADRCEAGSGVDRRSRDMM